MEQENSEEKALIERSLDGDTTAFKELVVTHQKAALNLACSIVKDQDLAEDVLQTAFIKVYQKLHTFNYRSRFATWLYRIVVNTSYNALKKQRHHGNLEQREILAYPEAGKEITGHLDELDQKKYINLAMGQLKADEALVLRMFYLYDHKMTEIADVTGFGLSKIKVDLHRGRQNLKFQLTRLLGKEVNRLL